MTADELTGRAHGHIRRIADPECGLHADVAAPFAALRAAALAEGLDLVPQSSFRDFARQLAIWNGKFNGERPLSDAAGRPVDARGLSESERIDAILLWSALPGASRHHWGTDLDLIDRRALDPSYRVRLIAEEYAAGGPFHPAFLWLEEHAARFGFFRPYRGVRSGVAPEPWHFSFAPVAEGARRRLTVTSLREALVSAPLLGKTTVIARVEELHARYVAAIDWP